MMRSVFFILLLSIGSSISAQYKIPPYTVVNDSATHTTVIHNSDAEIIKIRNAYREQGLFIAISPDIKIKDGIVDHKGLTGTPYVREYYINNKLIGYLQYDGPNSEREIYYNAKGDIYLEIRHDKGALTYRNDSIRKPSVLDHPSKILHDYYAK
jgi:hypothetical protein